MGAREQQDGLLVTAEAQTAADLFRIVADGSLLDLQPDHVPLAAPLTDPP